LNVNTFQILEDKIIDSYLARIAAKSARLHSKQSGGKELYISAFSSLKHLQRVAPFTMDSLKNLKENACIGIYKRDIIDGHEAPP
jgi:hypothetical protein